MWTKEGYRTEQVSQMKRLLDDTTALPVVKERYLRKFSLDQHRPWKLAPAKCRARVACSS